MTYIAVIPILLLVSTDFFVNRYIIEKNKELDPERLVEYNPKLSEVTPATRVAYAKFKMPKIKLEFEEVGSGARKDSIDKGRGAPRSSTGDDDVFTGNPVKHF